MATVTATDFLVATGTPGLWVRLHNNVSGTDYYSTAVSDPQGAFTYTVPTGEYSLYVGSAATVPGTPTLRNGHFQVAVRNGDDAALNSGTFQSTGPYTPTAVAGGEDFSGAVRIIGSHPWIDVTHPTYGAKGDGVTDDTAAIAAAITAAPAGSVLYIPPLSGATFYIVSNLTVLKPLTVMGGGWGQTGQVRRFGQASELIAATTTVYSSSRLKAKSSSTGYMWNIGQHDNGGTANTFLSYDGALEGFFMRDVVLDGNARTVDIGAVKMNTVEHGRMDRIRTEHFCREALKCEEYVREYEFNGIWTFFCGNTTDGQGPAPAYYPALNLFDNSAGLDLHNLLVFDNLLLFYSLSDAALIDTQATVGGSQVRDIAFTDCYVHGPVSGVSGFPYAFSALQQTTTTFQIKSCTDVRIMNSNVISTGTADSGGTGANNFVRVRTGASGVAPTIICLTGDTFTGRYSFANTPRYGVWVQNGDIRIETCHIDGGDTANIRGEAAATIYYGLLNVTPAGTSLAGGAALQTIPMQVTWAAQQEVKYAGATVSHRISNVDTARTFSFNAASAANGNVPGAAGGYYIFDETGGYRLVYVDTTGHWHHDKDHSIGGHVINNDARGTPTTANLGANVTSATPTGNDAQGTLVIVMSAGLAANTRICRVSWKTAWAGATAPLVLLVNHTSGVGLAVVNFYATGETTGGFDLFSDQALVAGTYTLRYLGVGVA